MKLEWLDEALAGLDRFVEFLNRAHRSLASIGVGEIVSRLTTRDYGDQSRVERNTARSNCKF
jgi:hypothetical protein